MLPSWASQSARNAAIRNGDHADCSRATRPAGDVPTRAACRSTSHCTPVAAAVPPAARPTLWLLAAASGVVNYALPFWLCLVAVRTLSVGLAAQFLALIRSW
jgi:hypothetical protein